jgi:hypothetical protein
MESSVHEEMFYFCAPTLGGGGSFIPFIPVLPFSFVSHVAHKVFDLESENFTGMLISTHSCPDCNFVMHRGILK